MFPRRPLFVTILLVCSGTTGSLSAQVLDLSGGWRFHPGDDPRWAQPNYDDAQWPVLQSGETWEAQGYPNLDGFAWYRKQISIPKTMSEQTRYRLSGALWLSLDRIDDVHETWINGQRVGGRGTFPPQYVSAQKSRQAYAVPGRLLRWGQTNLIAVRVYDGQGDGGLIGNRPRLRVATAKEVLALNWDLRGSNGLFDAAGPIIFRMRLHNGTPHTWDGRLHWTVEDDEGTALGSTVQPYTLPVDKVMSAEHTFEPPAPGFYRVTCEFRSLDEKLKTKLSRIVGYQPQAIVAPLPRATDFAAFWKQTREALDRVPPAYAIQRRAELDTTHHEVYEVSMHSLDNVRVSGWYQKPKSSGPVPALIRVPGYGQNMQPLRKQSRQLASMAILSFNIRGHGNSQQDVPGQPADFWIRGLDDKQQYYYRGAYMDCLRAVDFLATRSEIDPTRIAIAGGSQGGGLSLATAALDSRISLCAADIPFLCDWVKYFKASHWPEMDKWIAAKPERSWKSTFRTLSYFDTLNLVDRIRCPVLISLGVQDGVCPASTVFSVYNRLQHRKQFRAYPETGHQVPAAHHMLRTRWIAREFSRIGPPPTNR